MSWLVLKCKLRNWQLRYFDKPQDYLTTTQAVSKVVVNTKKKRRNVLNARNRFLFSAQRWPLHFEHSISKHLKDAPKSHILRYRLKFLPKSCLLILQTFDVRFQDAQWNNLNCVTFQNIITAAIPHSLQFWKIKQSISNKS